MVTGPSSFGMTEPVVEARLAKARIVARGKGPIVQHRAEIGCLSVCGHRACIPGCAQVSTHNIAKSDPLGPAISIVPLSGAASATSAMASATSSAAIG